MIAGIVYGQSWRGTWQHAAIGSVPHNYDWKCNECFWLLPWVAQDMCWGKPKPKMGD